MIASKLIDDWPIDREPPIEELAFGIEACQGQFKLMVVRCNSDRLRTQAIARLQQILPLDLRELKLPKSTTTLLGTIRSAIADDPPDALNIWGFESVVEIDRLLNATNQVREEFRQHFPFPLILWVNDEILQKLIRLVPDFESWTTIVEFSILTKDLVQFIQEESDRILNEFLAPFNHQLLLGHALMDSDRQREFCWTIEELKMRKIELPPELEARVQFILGRQAYEKDELERAERLYLQSLSFWEQNSIVETQESGVELSVEKNERHRLENRGIVLLHLGLCYFRQAELRAVQRQYNWELARDRLQSCLDVFEAANRPDLVARLITYLGEILRYLESWDALEKVVQRSVPLHETYGKPIQLAVDYGFLAEIALQHRQWHRANHFASQALQILDESFTAGNHHYLPYYPLLAQLYRLFLVKAQTQIDCSQEATENLEQAVRELPQVIEANTPLYDPWRYLRILEGLRRLYFEEGRYLEAFGIKLKQRSIEAAYGFRAFIGAGRLEAYREAIAIAPTASNLEENVAREIQAAGRQNDVEQLRERTLRPDCKLTILYGPSGVGKSSILHAGLIPALKRISPNSRDVIPISIRVYSDWCRELGKRLAKAIGISPKDRVEEAAETIHPLSHGFTVDGECGSTAILEQLRQNGEQNRVTVLVLEQFEEFFFNNPQLNQRLSFYAFFKEALKLPYFSIIVSIREDYIDNLLELERFIDSERESRDILAKKNRYYLGNLSPESARKVIRVLTQRAHFDLEPQLLERLVEDLADEQGEIRPIELQIVGTQLQAENIQTLEKYERSGNFKNLVEGFIEEAVRDCGRENETLAQLILFFLTGENNSRPLKTRSELTKDLDRNPEELNLVLKILKQSGLIVAHPEVPHHRYQLVHDYLVPLIRQQQELAKEAETQALRQENRLLRELAEAQTKQKQSDTRFVRSLVFALAGTILSVIGFAGLWLFATGETRKAEEAQQEAAIAEIDAHNSASKALLLSSHQFEALVESVKAGRQLQQLQQPDTLPIQADRIRGQILSQVQQAFYGITERNRLEGHSNSVLDVAFSPNGRWIASASQDRTIKLWQPNGTLVQTLSDNEGAATSVSFSPDNRLLATASEDRQGRGKVTLWQIDPRSTRTLRSWIANPETVAHVAFSPDGLHLIAASWDKTVKLWTLDGQEVATLKGHDREVMDASFSPDGRTIATVSLDKTVRLWDLQGKLLKVLVGHTEGVTGVAFSPDGQILATSSADYTVKLWTPDGKEIATLEKPNGDKVWDVTFSPDGQTLATASEDKTVTLWTRSGKPMQTLRGHRKLIRSVSFSPDGRTIATASEDNTIELWSPQRPKQLALRGHQGGIWAVGFSPNGQMVVTGSEDGAVKLWRPNGTLLNTLNSDGQSVKWVGFSPDGRAIASASDDGTLKLRKSDGTVLTTIKHGESISAASFSPDGNTIATVGDKALKLWNRNGTRRQTFLANADAEINSVTFSPDGQTIATGHGDHQGSDYTVKLWNLQGTLLQTFVGHQSSVNWVSFSPDGQTIASASNDKTLKLWNLEGNTIQAFIDHIGRVYWVSFSPDGQTIASAGDDGTVKLWGVTDGKLLTTFEGHKAAVLSVSFSPDGKQLASASKDTIVLLWNLNLEDLLDRSCDWVADYLESNRNVKESDRALCDSRRGGG
jgi:WD40 repeat protein